jgi:hypothetical protein
MVTATVGSILGWALFYLVAGVALYLLGIYALAELRIWWARQTGEGSCQHCGRSLTIEVAGLMRRPVGFFPVCSWCGRDQPEGSATQNQA